jgi:hypothetical protein
MSLKTMIVSCLLLAAPAFAAPAGYQFTLQKPQTDGPRVVIRDTLWSCTETACRVSAIKSSPAATCATAAKQLGPIATFEAKGKALSADQLAKCNAKAK